MADHFNHNYATETATTVLQEEEGFREQRYPDGYNDDGTEKYSIGYGFNGQWSEDDRIDQKDAAEQLRKRAAAIVNKLHRHHPDMNEHQIAAMATQVFNVGDGYFNSKAQKYWKEGKKDLFREEAFTTERAWVKARRKDGTMETVPGLVKRRLRAQDLFDKQVPGWKKYENLIEGRVDENGMVTGAPSVQEVESVVTSMLEGTNVTMNDVAKFAHDMSPMGQVDAGIQSKQAFEAGHWGLGTLFLLGAVPIGGPAVRATGKGIKSLFGKGGRTVAEEGGEAFLSRVLKQDLESALQVAKNGDLNIGPDALEELDRFVRFPEAYTDKQRDDMLNEVMSYHLSNESVDTLRNVAMNSPIEAEQVATRIWNFRQRQAYNMLQELPGVGPVPPPRYMEAGMRIGALPHAEGVVREGADGMMLAPLENQPPELQRWMSQHWTGSHPIDPSETAIADRVWFRGADSIKPGHETPFAKSVIDPRETGTHIGSPTAANVFALRNKNAIRNDKHALDGAKWMKEHLPSIMTEGKGLRWLDDQLDKYRLNLPNEIETAGLGYEEAHALHRTLAEMFKDSPTGFDARDIDEVQALFDQALNTRLAAINKGKAGGHITPLAVRVERAAPVIDSGHNSFDAIASDMDRFYNAIRRKLDDDMGDHAVATPEQWVAVAEREAMVWADVNETPIHDALISKAREYSAMWQDIAAKRASFYDIPYIAAANNRAMQDTLGQALMKQRGYDGLQYVNKKEDVNSISLIVFNPDDMKSLIGNSGEYADGTVNIMRGGLGVALAAGAVGGTTQEAQAAEPHINVQSGDVWDGEKKLKGQVQEALRLHSAGKIDLTEEDLRKVTGQGGHPDIGDRMDPEIDRIISDHFSQ